MTSRNWICDWFGHSDESIGSGREDFPSEGFVCRRCEHTHSENEWALPVPPPKIRKVGFWVFGACTLAGIVYLPFVIEDAVLYKSVTSQPGCCGFVSESWLERPITYLMVDAWTAPVWSENEAKTHRWLTTDGLVKGETKFWRILQKEPIASP